MEDLISFDESPGSPVCDYNVQQAHSTAIPEDVYDETRLRQRPRIPLGPAVPVLSYQWVDEKRREVQMRQYEESHKRGRAIFIVSHNSGLIEGVIDAVHKELSQLRRDIRFKVLGDAAFPYLSIDAPSEELAACIEEAQTLTDELISDKTVKTTAIFVEPPACPVNTVKVQLHHSGVSQSARPKISPCEATFSTLSQHSDREETYMAHFCQQLSGALKRVGRINSDFNLQVIFGHFHILSHQQKAASLGQGSDTQYGFDQLDTLIRHPRTKGDMKAQMGDLRGALQVLKAIKKHGSSFVAETMSVASAAEVRAEYVFEAESSQYRFRAYLQSAGDAGVGGQAGAFRTSRIQVFKVAERSGSGAELDITTLSVDRKFDWKIETVHASPEADKSFESLKSELRSAKIGFLQGQGERDEDYPHVRFHNRGRLVNVKKVAMNSIFRFMYSGTEYVVDLTIRREWNGIPDMSDGKDPTTTFGATVYGQHWRQTRASEVAKPGQGWGKELESLLGDDQDQEEAANGQDRVRGFVKTIHAIRNALSADA
ncbi:hypothetical protein BJ170DRAFT_685504 [Xylariales sp. AK1849]|nr:hypothetical protein BJ170DRAFT_685504 [Xylariales sp. AK1849]